MDDRVNRRQFLTTTAAGSAMWAGSRAARAASPHQAPSDRIRVAVMGANSRGAALARTFAAVPGAEVACICDVDERVVAKTAALVQERQGKSPAGMKDFRRALEDKNVDALVIAAPDHWHAPAAILACAAGKHVYVEKPCSHNAREGELLVAAARKHGRVVQMGNQRRSWPNVAEAVELMRGGAIGRLYYVRSWYANARGSIGKGKPAPLPSWLDYDLWQGPAPRRPYLDNIIHYNWHWFWHWGTAESGNNAVHGIDLGRWALGADYPIRVTSAGGRYHWKDSQETPDTQTMTFEFPEGRMLVWEGLSCNPYGMGGSSYGTTFHGETGTLSLEDSAYSIYDTKGKLVKKVDAAKAEVTLQGPAESLDAVHIVNFLDCIRSGKKPNSEIEGGHKSTLLIHLGNIALRTGRSLNCDPQNGHILADADAARLWGRTYEPGWAPSV